MPRATVQCNRRDFRALGLGAEVEHLLTGVSRITERGLCVVGD